ncbi:MAG: nucleotide sugar dehydrogenase [Nitrosopumilaceae archaeon]
MPKNLLSEIKSKKIIAVYGLGNVGGPIAAAWLRKGAKIIGVDISQNLISDIKKGVSHKKEPYVSETFTKALKNGKLELSSDGIATSKKSNIKIVAVPVGLKGKKIDLSALLSATTSISKGLKKGDAVIICPSLPPGTTETTVRKILEHNSKLKAEKDFYLIYNPERIFEGRALADIEENYPAIVSGLGPKSLEFADKLLKIISKKGTLKMFSLANAEAEKLFEGVYRDVNIALANELADYCERIGVNYWDARKGANSQPFCHLHYPGTGVGGLCIPVYPRFIIESSSKIGKHMNLVEYSRKTNDSMPKKCVNDAVKLLKTNKIKIPGSKIAILGLGFRGEVTDTRLSPTYVVIDEFLKLGCKISIHDPFILKDSSLPSKVNLGNNLTEVTKGASLIFISSDHKMYSKLTSKSFRNAKKPLSIFDGRNILNKNNFKNSSLLTIGKR